ncbi:MoxR-like ATPase [Paenibacillus sp. PastF-3]|uniref:AAA family ATPase n=1 Tax=unclassified Paenibacillus TaxID=185978 RepID=UPI000BA0C0D6|nr:MULTISPECIES: AAA family ATPase [unclassified Paenibacillus]MDH6372931.1 MoxR-like ATPase [Paenibacillus sp. PastF-3]OZQ77338.1 hypothetical protein CA598_29855 [Paenibacillus sp. VTT E-133291]
MNISNVIQQINYIDAYLNEKYYERSEIIFCSLVSLIAAEHMLLIGPPGAAKSSVLDDICDFIREVKLFKWTMNKETKIDEILGPYEPYRMEYGEYIRLTQNKLPEADLAFLDETLRATGDTLNSLLEIMNERTFIQNNISTKVPLISLFGATNSYPKDEDIQALYDRFLVRIRIDYIKESDNLRGLLTQKPKSSDEVLGSITLEDIKQLRLEMKKVQVPELIIDMIIKMRDQLFKKEIFPSDRRLRNSLNLLRAAAVVRGRNIVEVSDLYLLKHVFWLYEKDQDDVNEIVTHVIEKEESQNE